MIDTLLFFIDIENYDDIIDTLTTKLDKKKEEAKEAIRNNSSKIVSIEIGSMTYEVLPNGKKGYAYILHNDLYEVDIAEYRSRNKDFYPIFIKIKSECLWSYGPYQAWTNVCQWVLDNIGNITDEKISRIDLCCHTDEFCIASDDLVENFKGQFYTQTAYWYRRKVNAMTFGSSASNKIFARIYDKVLEINQRKSKKWFYEIWKNAGMNCGKVWNIEFQINREFMKDRNINSVNDAFNNIGSIWEYCTIQWLLKINLDNERSTRCSINEKWLQIQKCFKEYDSKPLIKREKQLNMDAEAMVPATYGNITTFAAKLGMKDPAMVLKQLHNRGEEYLKSKKLNFKKIVSKKEALLDQERRMQPIKV